MTITRITGWLGDLPRPYKQLVMAASDALLLIMALWAAFSLRLGTLYVPQPPVLWVMLAAPLLAIPLFIRFGLYRAIVRYIGLKAIWVVVQAVSLYALTWAVLAFLSGVESIPRSVILINWLVAILLIGGSRMLARWWFLRLQSEPDASVHGRISVLIYGAGASGIQLATALSFSQQYRPVAFIDDNPALQGHQINGLPVFAFSALDKLIKRLRVREIMLAMPSAPRSRRKMIIRRLEPYSVHVKTLPGFTELADGRVKIEDVKEVEIDDLLGRDHVEPRPELIEANVRDKVVMVTGAGGSIGSELCRQILKHHPRQLLLYEQNEYALYNIDHELIHAPAYQGSSADRVAQRQVLPVLGSVLDQARLERLCTAFGVQTLYHAAAYKHVPMVEMNPVAAIRNNIFGTLHPAQAAINTGVESFVLISTDKAVRPTNTMGASKRFAELILQALSRRQDVGTRFSMVRFGNVLDSSGSVIPLFRRQIQNGGPVTVTDPRIIRYFMTIPEAAELVIQAGAMGQGGDVFVLDMGEPVKILDLAQHMIRLSGLEVRDEEHPDGDIAIEITGLRPGEKLFEELLIGDNVSETCHPAIMRAEEDALDWSRLEAYLKRLDAAVQSFDQQTIRDVLLDAVKGFNPQCGIEDLVYKNAVGMAGENVLEIGNL
ncbi:polysaccharide biosynthesis protein [Thiohalophilus thiocyanatoxydans]|uniref:FlaA1/EpsC-like NDP-sugar epimerase n=1 Tax=Thiohalophilus thiocyanatoxydans TaxID=381308 RepID=A0A4R8IXR8_9GAMM|nr:nucleoside-diphosphate sugar epimerase/dehydratase [Thiohalophilus thiocyanatoxydans]TDY02707.1 FlaA1/EpsC-like NDP-sugar epimerase [Thiohalophilus thiocyanatoxydans]